MKRKRWKVGTCAHKNLSDRFFNYAAALICTGWVRRCLKCGKCVQDESKES